MISWSQTKTLRCIYPPFELSTNLKRHPSASVVTTTRSQVTQGRENAPPLRGPSLWGLGRCSTKMAYWPTFFSQFLLVNCRYIYTIYIEFLWKGVASNLTGWKITVFNPRCSTIFEDGNVNILWWFFPSKVRKSQMLHRCTIYLHEWLRFGLVNVV